MGGKYGGWRRDSMSPSPGDSLPSAKTLSHHLIQCQGAVRKAIPFTSPTALRSHWLRRRSRLTSMKVWRGACKLLPETLALSAGKGWVQLGSLNKYTVQSEQEEPLGPKCPQWRSTRCGDAALSSLLLDGVPASLPHLSWAGPRAQCLSRPVV